MVVVCACYLSQPPSIRGKHAQKGGPEPSAEPSLVTVCAYDLLAAASVLSRRANTHPNPHTHSGALGQQLSFPSSGNVYPAYPSSSLPGAPLQAPLTQLPPSGQTIFSGGSARMPQKPQPQPPVEQPNGAGSCPSHQQHASDPAPSVKAGESFPNSSVSQEPSPMCTGEQGSGG